MEIVSGAEVNGAVIHCLLLTRSLAERGHRVTLLCRENAFIAGQLADYDVEIITSDMHRLPFDELRRVAGVCRERQIEIVHTHMTRAHNFGVCLRHFYKAPCVATAHSHIIQPHWMFNDHIIAVSDATRRFQRAKNFVRNQRIETIHGFMDYPRFAHVSSEAGCQVRKEWGIGETTSLLGIIGDIIPRKGQIDMIRALPQIISHHPNARLVIVGEPKRGIEYFQKVRAEAERLNVMQYILWTGHRNDIPEVMSALDIYVLASLDEMFPVAVLEAMAAGRAIVATRVGGVPECLEDRVTALLIPPQDPSALALALETLINDPDLRCSLGMRARSVAHAQFSVESQTPRIETVFERLISQNSGRAKIKNQIRK